jgi:hypothetical protein
MVVRARIDLFYEYSFVKHSPPLIEHCPLPHRSSGEPRKARHGPGRAFHAPTDWRRRRDLSDRDRFRGLVAVSVGRSQVPLALSSPPDTRSRRSSSGAWGLLIRMSPSTHPVELLSRCQVSAVVLSTGRVLRGVPAPIQAGELRSTTVRFITNGKQWYRDASPVPCRSGYTEVGLSPFQGILAEIRS